MLHFRGKDYNIAAVDCETFYDVGYSLTHMPTSLYVQDKRFLVHALGLKYNDQPVQVATTAEDIKALLASIDWKNTLLLCHNTPFDGFILTQRYKIRPAGYLDSLAMARAALGHSVKHGLDPVARMLGLGEKLLPGALASTKGLRVLPPALLADLVTYCGNDTLLSRLIFDALLGFIPDEELELIDITTRMFCEPLLQVDKVLVQEEIDAEIAGKIAALMQCGATGDELRSNTLFAAKLRSLGVVVPMKVSPSGKGVIPAFAKTDPGMSALLNHADPKVAALAAARITLKSSIGESRATRFKEVAAKGRMPVLLHYYGAHTGRWSGGNKLNLQNLPRMAPGDPASGRLRRSLRAPKGKVLVVADSGQIEARVNAWLAGQHDLIEIFRAYDRGDGPDSYKVMASQLFRIPIEQVAKDQRFVGKVCRLALGFGMGADKLQNTLRLAGIPVHRDVAQEYVDIYRAENHHIVRYWRQLDNVLARMTMQGCDIEFGPLRFMHQAVRLPSELFLRYPGLMCEEREKSFMGRDGRTKIYGGLFCENVVQAVARCIIAEQIRTLDAAGYRCVMTTHDEVVVMTTEKRGQKCLDFMLETLATPPAWAKGLPLAAEGGFAREYSK